MKKYKITLKFKKGKSKDIIAKKGIISINELDLHYCIDETTKKIVEDRILKEMLKFEWEIVDEETADNEN